MMKNSTICLVSPPTRANSYVVPFALLHLSAWLGKEGIRSHILDIKKRTFKRTLTKNDINGLMPKIVKGLKDIAPDYVGITCFTYDYNVVLKLAEMIKSEIKTKIIVGGIHPTLKPFDFLFEGSPFDYVINGEGEIPLTEFLLMEKNNKSLEDIPGLGYRDNSGKFRVNENSSIADYGLLPQLPYDKIDMDFYTTPNPGLIRYIYSSGIHILTTKGCPYSCTFCANRMHKISYRSIKTVADEIVFLKEKYRIDSFYIQDDTFGIKRDRVIDFLDELKSRKICLFWGMETRVNLLDDELAGRLSKSGCIQIDFGVESGSQASLDRMKKGIRVEDSIKAFGLCRKYHMRTLANIMFNTPGETEEDVSKTVDLIKKIRPTVLGVMLTLPLPGTQIYEEYVKPEIERSQYYLFENDEMYMRILDKRFKLARHDINLTKLREKLVYTYIFPRAIMDYTGNLDYWKGMLSSRRKFQYIGKVLSDLFLYNIWRVCLYFNRLYKRTSKRPRNTFSS